MRHIYVEQVKSAEFQSAKRIFLRYFEHINLIALKGFNN